MNNKCAKKVNLTEIMQLLVLCVRLEKKQRTSAVICELRLQSDACSALHASGQIWASVNPLPHLLVKIMMIVMMLPCVVWKFWFCATMRARNEIWEKIVFQAANPQSGMMPVLLFEPLWLLCLSTHVFKLFSFIAERCNLTSLCFQIVQHLNPITYSGKVLDWTIWMFCGQGNSLIR